MIFYILLIIVIIVIEENEKSKIIKEAKNKKRNINFCPYCGKSLIDNIHQEIHNEVITSNEEKTQDEKQIIKKEKPIINKKDLKNNIILITGAILIVLAAIIFLLSSWYNLSDIFKSIVILMMTGFFAFLSNIAKKYNLNNTSETFLYISLAYLPISLVSISLFNLLGDFFSISGAGKNIYLALSFVITSGVYIYINKIYNKKLIYTFNIIAQLLSTIFLTLIFTNNYLIVLTSLNIYISLLIINSDINKNTITIYILNYLLMFIFIVSNLVYILIDDISLLNILPLIVMIINQYIIYKKDNNIIFKWIYPLLITFTFYSIANLYYIDFSYLDKQLLILVSTIVIIVINLLKNKKILFSTYIEVSIIYLLMYFSSIIHYNESTILYPYIILYIFTLFNILFYMYNNEYKNAIAYIFTSCIFLSTLSMINYYNMDTTILYLISIIAVIIPLTNIKIDNIITKSFSIVGLIFIIISSVFSDANIINTILTLITIAIYYLYTENKSINYKYVVYYAINIVLFKVLYLFNIDVQYAIPISTIIVGIIDIYYKKYQDKFNKVLLLIEYIISILILNIDININTFIVLTILNIITLYYVYRNKINIKILILIMTSLIPSIYFANILNVGEFNIMYYISYFLIIVLMFLGQEKKITQHTIMSYALFIIHIYTIERFKYIGSLVFIIINIYNYLKDNKYKDLYKELIYISVLILYYMIINDLYLTSYILLKYGILNVFVLLTTRTILNKYIKDIKLLEYISFIIINYLAIANVGNELNGIYYTSFLVIFTMISYIKKYGPSFIISIIFIMLNLFLLTREFWFSIPWWLYILIVGIVLILFAMNNELNNKNRLKEKAKELKEKLDL